jgi:hypothetical protein
MSRNRRRENRRKASEARKMESLDADLRRLAESDQVETMTQAHALEVIAGAADVLAQRMTQDGMAGRPPWGGVAFDYKALQGSIQTSIRMIQDADSGMDRADDADFTDEQALRTMLELVAGLATMGAAATLWLASLPMPPDLIRHVRAVEDPSV